MRVKKVKEYNRFVQKEFLDFYLKNNTDDITNLCDIEAKKPGKPLFPE